MKVKIDTTEDKYDVRIDNSDVWSMDHTLAHIVVPMLEELRKCKHGSPVVDEEDLPEGKKWKPKKDHDGDLIHVKWEWVLDEMIWAWQQQRKGQWEWRHDVEHAERVKNGMRLFVKYYNCLWD